MLASKPRRTEHEMMLVLLFVLLSVDVLFPAFKYLVQDVRLSKGEAAK